MESELSKLKDGDVIETFEILEKSFEEKRYGMVCRMFQLIQKTLKAKNIPLEYTYLDIKRVQMKLEENSPKLQEVIQYRLIFDPKMLIVNKKTLALSTIDQRLIKEQ